ncbi:MAG TPA: HAMP domain-containing sensor histidine kinase [Humisphaera sp.]
MQQSFNDATENVRHQPPPPPLPPPPAADAWHESLAMALHDLGGALSVVHGTVQLWRLGTRAHASPADDWASVQSASGRAVRLSRELLDLCRLGHSQFRLDRRSVELVALVAALVDRRRPAFEAAGQRLGAEVPDGGLWVAADRDLLERAVDNLLDNAAKYTRAGGHVTVGVGRCDGDAIVRVRDTGVGIPAEFLPRVFEPFAREDRRAVREHPGSGVGLLAVRRIVELHGGRVEASSPGPGLGSEFALRLPVASVDPALARRASCSA